MALYRTYRPATFAAVVGQEHVTQPLSRALDAGRINHAYLFSGPRGCGKTSSARILARSLNCVHGPTSTPCGECASCVSLAPGGAGNLDVIELDAASHGGVEDTRDLRDKAFFAPAESRYRVFIIDEAHMVSSAGFNALLKVVEEPPEHLIFIFATTEPDKVLATIRSRTHHYPFRLIAPPVMRGLLESICEREHVTVDPRVYPLVIRAGGGSPRDSLSVLDQLLAGADDEGVGYERALSLLGVTDIALIDATVNALADANGAEIFGAVEGVIDAGHDPRRFAIDLLERFRDLILLHAVPDAPERRLVDVPDDQVATMRDQVARIGLGTLTRYAETTQAALGEMRGTTSPRLLLEVMCARMLLPASSDTETALLQRVERLEAQLASGVVASASTPRGSGELPSSAPHTISPPSAGSPLARQPVADEPPSRYIRKSKQTASTEPALPPSSPDAATSKAALQSETVVPQSISDDALPSEPTELPTQAEETAQPVAQAEPDSLPPTEPVPGAVRPVAADSNDLAESATTPNDEPDFTGAPEPEDTDLPGASDTDIADDSVTSARLVEQIAGNEQAAGPDVAAVRAAWGDIRAWIGQHDKVTQVMLSAAMVRAVDGHDLTISHNSAALVGRLSHDRGREAVAAAMQEKFGGKWSVQCVHLADDDVSVAQSPRVGGAGQTGQGEQAAPLPVYTRKTRSAAVPDEQPAAPEEPAVEPPPPPTPDDELSDAERAEMVAGTHDGQPDPRYDPEQSALALLESELGARRID